MELFIKQNGGIPTQAITLLPAICLEGKGKGISEILYKAEVSRPRGFENKRFSLLRLQENGVKTTGQS